MDLEGLLNASLELEKRKATDQLLRKYFSSLWKDGPAKRAIVHAPPKPTNDQSGFREITLHFPAEMCELLELASKSTGKTPSEILEMTFAEFYLKKVNPPLEK